MVKKAVPVSKALRLINNGPVVMVSSILNEKPNILTLSWCTPLSRDPMLVGIAIGTNNYSHDMILKTREFVINIPHSGMLEKIVNCGKISGKEKDKFKELKLTPKEASYVAAPIIAECIGHIECRVRDIIPVGDHSLFVARVVAASAEEEYFDDTWKLDKISLASHLGGLKFQISGKEATP